VAMLPQRSATPLEPCTGRKRLDSPPTRKPGLTLWHAAGSIPAWGPADTVSAPGCSAPQRAWIGLGANLGDARRTLAAACEALQVLPHTRWAGCSAWYRTAPVEAQGPDFLNLVVGLDSTLTPLDLLDALQAIEAQHGRERPYRNAPRTLDLDLLAHGDVVIDSARLVLPHPRWLGRAFVLRPLLDLLPAADLASQPVWRRDLAAAGLVDAPALLTHVQTLSRTQGVERLLASP
jgi:2-amino-4-hydroxy-6-hydroxymethyldihydropteridine diphosphokinase